MTNKNDLYSGDWVKRQSVENVTCFRCFTEYNIKPLLLVFQRQTGIILKNHIALNVNVDYIGVIYEEA